MVQLHSGVPCTYKNKCGASIHCFGGISWLNENAKVQTNVSDKLSYIQERCKISIYEYICLY